MVKEGESETAMEVEKKPEEAKTNGNAAEDGPTPAKRAKSEESEEKKDESKEEDGVDEKGNKKKARSPDLAKFWKAVEDDPTDFTGWTYLLQFVDTTGDITDGREAYDAFLYRYPYCYGYWKKYADLEKRKGTPEKAMEVFERGMKAIPLSADLWIHYLTHVRSEFGGKHDYVREQYEKAIHACGRDWRSDKLWDHYVKWETSIEKEKEVGTKNYHRVVAIYDRILANPTQGLSHQFDMFKDFVKENAPKDIMEVDDFLSLRKEVLASLKKDSTDTESADAPGENETSTTTSEEENTSMKEKIISARKKIYKSTEEKVQLRWKYEDAIKRPYFHMKPLERGQLKNWAAYLEFEEAQNKKNEVTDQSNLEILYERCMIACALYEEFWMKYVQWLQRTETAENSLEVHSKIRDVYARACNHHLPDKVDIHMSWAAYEEKQSNGEKSAEILERLVAKHPNLVSVKLCRINLERRLGNIETVHKLFKSCMEETAKAKSEIAIKYARFLRLGLEDEEAAINVLNEAVEADDKNAKLYLQLLDIALHSQPLDQNAVTDVMDKAIGCTGMPAKTKLLFSKRKVEFLEDFGSDVQDLLAAKDENEKITEEAKKEAEKTEAKGEKAIETIEGRSGKAKKNGSTSEAATTSTTTYPATNSATYNASHASSYDQYGSRYDYGQQYNQYYQGYYQSGATSY